MGYKVALDPKSNTEIIIKLYKNVKNISDLRKKVLSGDLNCCILKPSLILDPFQIVIAANKAVIAEKLTTKTIYTELLFNLSISKNITQSLQKFGIDDKENNIIVAIIKKIDEECANESEIFKEICGEEVDVNELNTFTDLGLIKKAYKISEIECKKISLIDSVITRIATKDIMTV